MHDPTAHTATTAESPRIDRAIRSVLHADAPIDRALAEITSLPGVDCAALLDATHEESPVVLAVLPRLLPGSPVPPWIAEGVALDAPSEQVIRLEVGAPDQPRDLILKSHTMLAASSIGLAASIGALAVALDAERVTGNTAQSLDSGAAGRAIAVASALNLYDRPDACFRAACDAAAAQFVADRVSLAVQAGGQIKVLMTSHAERVQQKASVVRLIGEAAAESIDQGEAVQYPASASAISVNRACKDLGANQGSGAGVLSVPIVVGERTAGAMVIERFDRAIGREDLRAAQLLSSLIGRRLDELVLAQRGPLGRLAHAARSVAALLVGPRYTWAKLLIGLAIVCVVASAIIPGTDYRVAQATVASREVRVMSAPFAGFIERGYVRPGDRVVAGETLIAEFETSQIELELAQARAQQSAARTESARQQEAGALAQAAVASARADEIEAQIELLEYQLANARLIAPISGVVVQGDAIELSGAGVPLGQAIVRIVDPASVELELSIPQSEFDRVERGAIGSFVLPAFPDDPVRFEIYQVGGFTSDPEATDTIAARGSIEERPQWLAPGMTGTARIEAGRSSLLDIWTRRLVNWVRLTLWI